jgi:hypothetical protein
VLLPVCRRIISSMLAPSGLLNRVRTRSCLVNRSSFGSSAFDGVLALAAPGATLRRDGAGDLTLTFLDPALLAFRDFSTERVGVVLGEPPCAGRKPSSPADAHSNACFAAEVQSVLRPEIRSHVLGKPGRNNGRLAFPQTLNFWPRTHRLSSATQYRRLRAMHIKCRRP